MKNAFTLRDPNARTCNIPIDYTFIVDGNGSVAVVTRYADFDQINRMDADKARAEWRRCMRTGCVLADAPTYTRIEVDEYRRPQCFR